MSSDAPASGRSQGDSPKTVEPQIKGVAVRDVVTALKDRLEEAEAKIPDHLRHYLEDRVLVASWYPESEHMELTELVAEIYGKPGKDVWFWMGQRTASMDLTSLYRAMIQEGQPSTTLKRLPKLWRLYRTAGRIKVQTIGSTKGLVRLYDYPFVTRRFAKMMSGYISEALVISGGKRVLVNTTSLGTKVGTSCIWAVSWS